MPLPTVITPGSSGHLTDHEIIHGYLDDITGSRLLTQFSQGTYASRPAAGTAGAFYLATNVPALYFDTGSGWELVSPKIRRGYDTMTADLPLTTSYVDATGISIAISTIVNAVPFIAIAAFEWNISTVAPGTLEGVLLVNAVQQGQRSSFTITGASDQAIATTVGIWEGVCGTAGSQTFKLQARKGVTAGVAHLQSAGTSLLVLVFDG